MKALNIQVDDSLYPALLEFYRTCQKIKLKYKNKLQMIASALNKQWTTHLIKIKNYINAYPDAAFNIRTGLNSAKTYY